MPLHCEPTENFQLCYCSHHSLYIMNGWREAACAGFGGAHTDRVLASSSLTLSSTTGSECGC